MSAVFLLQLTQTIARQTNDARENKYGTMLTHVRLNLPIATKY
jgi:hypothetical protein